MVSLTIDAFGTFYALMVFLITRFGAVAKILEWVLRLHMAKAASGTQKCSTCDYSGSCLCTCHIDCFRKLFLLPLCTFPRPSCLLLKGATKVTCRMTEVTSAARLSVLETMSWWWSWSEQSDAVWDALKRPVEHVNPLQIGYWIHRHGARNSALDQCMKNTVKFSYKLKRRCNFLF